MVNKLLLTGFGPFLNFRYNPSGAVAKEFDGRIFGKCKIVGRVLPVSHGEASTELTRLMKRERPEVVIATGLAATKGSIILERVAINRFYFVGNTGAVQDEPLSPLGPAAYFSTLPFSKIRSNLEKAGIPAEYSFWPDTFVSNEVFYTLMDYAKNNRIKTAGFVHLPLTHAQLIGNKGIHYMAKSSMPSLDEKMERKGIEILIKTVVGDR